MLDGLVSTAEGLAAELYFNPQHEEFEPRTTWSRSNAFTSAFKELDPIPQFKATAKLGGFLEARFSVSYGAVWVRPLLGDHDQR